MDVLEGVHLAEDWHGAMLGFATRAHNSLTVAATLVRDYPIQAMILGRAVYEDVQTADHLQAKPADRHFWLDPKYAEWKWSKKVPKFGVMRAEMEDEDVAAKLKEAYHVMSQYGHPTVSSWHVEVLETADVAHFHMGPRADFKLSLFAVYLLIVGANAMRIVAVFVKSRAPAWWAAYEGFVTEVSVWLKQVLVALAIDKPEDDDALAEDV